MEEQLIQKIIDSKKTIFKREYELNSDVSITLRLYSCLGTKEEIYIKLNSKNDIITIGELFSMKFLNAYHSQSVMEFIISQLFYSAGFNVDILPPNRNNEVTKYFLINWSKNTGVSTKAFSEKGVPDMILNNRFLLEVKDYNDRLSKEQIMWAKNNQDFYIIQLVSPEVPEGKRIINI